MHKEQPSPLDQRMQSAIAELQHTIRQRYPAAQFEIARAADDPRIVHLLTTVDVDDPDEVGDLVIDRIAELVAEEHLPVHVIPIRPSERVETERQAQRGRRRARRTIPLLGRPPTP